jgi:adenylylsulfate kinase
MVIWIVGLSGSGKTTIARSLRNSWINSNPNTVLVDGDEMRQIFRTDQAHVDYNVAARRTNAERIVRTCQWLDKQELHVICSILCIFPDILQNNRNNFSDYFEIFLDAPLDQIENDDTKGIYSAGRSGRIKNVVGLDLPFPRPNNSDLTIDNSNPKSNPEDIAQLITTSIESRP